VEVAIEDEAHRPALARGERVQRIQRLDVAVEPADHVERLRDDLGLAIEYAWRVPI
jgi:hypothetical protein